MGLGEHERAVALYRELLRGTSADADVHLSIAHALKTIGRREEAIESYRNAAAARPDFGDAYWSIANLKTYRFTPEELARLKALLAGPRASARSIDTTCASRWARPWRTRASTPSPSVITRWAMRSSAPRATTVRSDHREQHPLAD